MVDLFFISLFACLGEGLATCLTAGEPSDLSTNTPLVMATPRAEIMHSAPAVRNLGEGELLELLTAALQQEYARDRGELELHLARPWIARTVPSQPITLKVLEMPKSGIASSFLLRFELCSETNSLGSWQVPVQARLWRELWVARSPAKRGELVVDADLDRQRRDVLALHESVADFAAGDTTLEIAEPLQAGSPVLARSVRIRPVIRRGQSADALVQDGALSITMKVEVLEDGAPGQIIRARNAQTRRDLRGKVLNEQTILVAL